MSRTPTAAALAFSFTSSSSVNAQRRGRLPFSLSQMGRGRDVVVNGGDRNGPDYTCDRDYLEGLLGRKIQRDQPAEQNRRNNGADPSRREVEADRRRPDRRRVEHSAIGIGQQLRAEREGAESTDDEER